jgi:hypothetical protein
MLFHEFLTFLTFDKMCILQKQQSFLWEKNKTVFIIWNVKLNTRKLPSRYIAYLCLVQCSVDTYPEIDGTFLINIHHI